MKAKDLRERTTEDLRELEKTIAQDLFESRFKNFTNRLDDTSSLRKHRRELARIKTILAEKVKGVAVPKATASKPAPAAAAAAAPKKAPAKKAAAPKKAAEPKAKKSPEKT
jgi:large subunit ribosomal protein L29